jgi:HK97 family phage portal protein
MSIFHSFSNWVMGGLRRSIGIQYATPSSYSEDAASTVTYDSAMQLSAVWACVKLLSETVASLPLTFYKTSENGRKPHDTHALSILFSGKVNRYQSKVEFFETVLLNLVVNGNAYCVITRSGDRIVSLLPIMSAQVEPMMLDDGEMVYNYQTDGGLAVFAATNIWHLKLMGNGTVGMSPLAYQRNSLGIAQAAESAVTKIYRNGAKPSGVLSIDRILKPEQREQVRANFATLTTSADDRLMVLEAGMKFDKVSLSPQDIELLSSRKFQISEVCRWYGVPSVMVNDNNGTSVWGSGIEQVMQGFYKLTLRPLLEKIEASIMVNLLTPAERGRMEVAFDFDALLRADVKSRYESYRLAITNGLMTPNEARAMEHLPEKDGGDQLLIQGAMAPVDGLAQHNAQAAAPVADPRAAAIDAAAKHDQLRAMSEEVKSLRTLIQKSGQQQPQNVKVSVDSDAMEKSVQNFLKIADNTLKQIREDIQNMPIVIPAPSVTVEAIMPELKQINPTVNVYNDVKPSEVTVIDNHPKRAVQVVERDGNDEILRTITTYEAK